MSKKQKLYSRTWKEAAEVIMKSPVKVNGRQWNEVGTMYFMHKRGVGATYRTSDLNYRYPNRSTSKRMMR